MEATKPHWLQEHLLAMRLLRAIGGARGTREVDDEWPGWMVVTLDEIMLDLPFTPPCRHVEPHTMRLVETEDELASYLTFKQCGWEQAGYCWGYVPAFLHEWYGCGPDQTLFVPS